MELLEGPSDAEDYAEIELEGTALETAISLFLDYGDKLSLPAVNRALSMSIEAGDSEAFTTFLNIKYTHPPRPGNEITFWPNLFKQMLSSGIRTESFNALCQRKELSPWLRGKALMAAIQELDSEVVSLLLQSGSLFAKDRIKAIHDIIPLGWIGIVKSLCNDPSITPRDLGKFLLQSVEGNYPESIEFFSDYTEIPTEYLFEVLVAHHIKEKVDLALSLLHKIEARDSHAIEKIFVQAISVQNRKLIEFLFEQGYDFGEIYRARAIVAALKSSDLGFARLLVSRGPISIGEIPHVLQATLIDGSPSLFDSIFELYRESVATLSSEDLDSLLKALLSRGHTGIILNFLKYCGKQISQRQRLQEIERAIQEENVRNLGILLLHTLFAEPPLDHETIATIFDQILSRDSNILLLTALTHLDYGREMQDIIRAAKMLKRASGGRHYAHEVVKTFLNRRETLAYSMGDWDSVMEPALQQAISTDAKEMVESLLRHGKISRELQKKCLSQATRSPNIRQLLSEKRVIPHRRCAGLRRWCRELWGAALRCCTKKCLNHVAEPGSNSALILSIQEIAPIPFQNEWKERILVRDTRFRYHPVRSIEEGELLDENDSDHSEEC
jgi:hypothetical protein